MSSEEWRRVPIGLDAGKWVTRSGCRTVLVAVHTLTAGQRLLDVVRLLEDDLRVQVVFTKAPDVFNDGVDEFLRAVRGAVIPWRQSVDQAFALALAASYGRIHEIHAPLIVLPHGVGYNKLARGGPAGRVAGPGTPYGLDAQRLMHNGSVVPASIVLAHDSERVRLARSCPEAMPAASVVGDPTYDRLVVSRPLREVYRRALEVAPGRRLIVVTSTWGPNSLFAVRHDLLERLTAEASAEGHRVVAMFHPNVWFGHGPLQVESWLAQSRRQGLVLIPPDTDWRGAMVAADWVVGDHGSATVYGAVTGAPVLVTGSSPDDVDPVSPASRLAAHAPRLDDGAPLLPQLHRAAAEHTPDRLRPVVEHITSEPGRFNRNMRRVIYRLLGLSTPASIPITEPVAPPELET
ncbi:MAG: hypothetical protein GEV11_12230 [Streptosporangiales bacterium]|nr:hypothetical protein [Streptosporangiales bacterium]